MSSSTWTENAKKGGRHGPAGRVWGQTPAVAEKGGSALWEKVCRPASRPPDVLDGPVWGQTPAVAARDGYFLDLMKAIRAFAFAGETEPGGIAELMTPFGKPFTICLSGSMIDSSR
jgi:hypothetical protein